MPTPTIKERIARCAAWPERCSPDQWAIYKAVIAEANRRGLRFAVGGGLAAMAYAGQWRNTKDIDLYIPESERDRMIGVVTDTGLEDYFEKQPYDRNWIYRSYKNDTIVDLIWAMANRRSVVDTSWFRGPQVEVDGERFGLLAPEEELWSKLYVLQRDRCDWPDALNLIYGVGLELDWRHLLARVENDAPLVAALVSIFAWLCPERAREFPSWIWKELRAGPPQSAPASDIAGRHARLLDSRPWFTPMLDEQDAGG
ncbi:MAG: hypothetical protein WB992_05125 [Bryobacteraceae bacterium]